MTTGYRSSIPKAATEVVIGQHPSGAKKRSQYYLGDELVGERQFHESGEPEGEWPQKDGRLHGTVYRWDEPGVLLSAEPYREGLPHGVAKQWHGGQLIGTYTMKRGTGVDLWWQVWEGRVYLSEVHYMEHGLLHGFDWWLNEDQRSLWSESHFFRGQPHGIEREWNEQGKLSRGYPKYWVEGRQVNKRQYLAASKRDKTLPAFRSVDDSPRRRFPPEVAAALGSPPRIQKSSR